MSKSIALIILLLASACSAYTSQVGDISVNLPNPPGFVRVDSSMTATGDLIRRFVNPTMSLRTAYIPESQAADAMMGDAGTITRWCSVQYYRKFGDFNATIFHLEDMKNTHRKNSEDKWKKMRQDLRDIQSDVNEGFREDFDFDLALSTSDHVELEPHDDRDRVFAYSAISRHWARRETGEVDDFLSITSMAFILLKDKILTVYVFGGKDDLSWTRDLLEDWTNALIAANPEDAMIDKTLELAPPGINWIEVIEKGLVGFATGGLAILLYFAINMLRFSRARRSQKIQ